MLEEHQTEECIPGVDFLRKAVGPACQAVGAVPDDSVQPLEMHGVRLVDVVADRRAHRDTRKRVPLPAASLAMIDGLGQADPIGWPQDIPARSDARRFSLPLGALDRHDVGLPTITDVPNAHLSLRPPPRHRHNRLSQGLLAWTSGLRSHEMALPIVAQAAPPLAAPHPLALQPNFFRRASYD